MQKKTGNDSSVTFDQVLFKLFDLSRVQNLFDSYKDIDRKVKHGNIFDEAKVTR